MHHMDANKTHAEKARWELNEYRMNYFEQILKATPYEPIAI